MSKPKAAKAKKPKAAKAKKPKAAKAKKPKAAVEAKPKVAVKEDMKSVAEELVKLSDADFKQKMPSLVSKVRGKYGELIDAKPDLPQKLVKRLEESDVKKNSIEAPQASDAFTELLWGVIGALVERKPELKKVVTEAGNIKISYEASDSPMKGHYELAAGKITGGPGSLKTADLKITGPTDVLIKLTTGALDSTAAYMAGQYKLEGSLAIGMKLTPVTKKTAEVLRGQ